MRKSIRILPLLFFVFLACTGSAPAQLKDIAKVSLSGKKVQIGPDGKGRVEVGMKIKDGWWSYNVPTSSEPVLEGPQPTTFTMVTPSFLTIDGRIKTSKPKKMYDPNFEMDVEKFEHNASFSIPVKVGKMVKAGSYEAAMEVYYMACNSSSCLPPDADTLRFTVVVPENMGAAEETESDAQAAPTDTAAAATAQVDNTTTSGTPDEPVSAPDGVQTAGQSQNTSADNVGIVTDSQQEIDQKKEEGLWSFLGFAMAQGALALLTPCVFPMIPITVSFFTKRAEKQRGKAHGLRDSLVYSIGIILTFTAIGFLFALLLGATGLSDFAANPWVNIIIAGIFIVLALNLFGAFEIRVPSGVLNSLNARSNEGDGIGSVLLMGLTFSLTSFTCTVPFVGATLVSVSSGDWVYPIVGMLGFASVFAAPFFLLALFPTAMTALPKAGGWMNNVKVVMGFLEIAAAIKFISNADLVWAWGILSREVFLAIWIACAAMIVLYVLGLYHLPHDSRVERVGAPRILFSLFFATVTFYLLSGLYGKPLGELDAFLPPKNYHELMQMASTGGTISSMAAEETEADAEEQWITSYEEGLRVAQQTGKPVFIDFTGFTCTNCRWMEANVFPQSDVRALMNDMVKVQLYTDRREEPFISNKKLQLERFGSIDLPLYVILKPDGEFVASKVFTRDKKEFIDFLKKAG